MHEGGNYSTSFPTLIIVCSNHPNWSEEMLNHEYYFQLGHIILVLQLPEETISPTVGL